MAAGFAMLILTARTGWAQSTATTTEKKQFEVVAVNGNEVVVKGENGATRELTVPPDFKLTVDGKEVTVADLKPGMKGTATITTTTTSVPVQVTEVKDAEVVQATGNSVTVRTKNGYKMFGPGDVKKRNAQLFRDGQPLDFADIRTGDHLTATIVTEGPPKTLTERQVHAAMTTPPPPAPKPEPAQPTMTTPPPTPPPTPAPEPKTEHLPKTAGNSGLIGVIGAIGLALGAMLAAWRRFIVAR
jgi:cell division septation protein DedD